MRTVYCGTDQRKSIEQVQSEGKLRYGLFAPWAGVSVCANYGTFQTIDDAVKEAKRLRLTGKLVQIHAQHSGYGYPECHIANVL